MTAVEVFILIIIFWDFEAQICRHAVSFVTLNCPFVCSSSRIKARTAEEI
jgi:hypothetical protein